MSPNLSSGHFASNAGLYEQVLYNLFSLVGLGSAIDHDISRLAANEKEMLAGPRDLSANITACVEHCDSG